MAEHGPNQTSTPPHTQSATTKAAALIGLDWGSTSLRAYLFDRDGLVMERRAEPAGVLNVVDRAFAPVLDRVIGGWLGQHGDITVIACGMIGSTVGWREVPYVPCPAGFHELAHALSMQRQAPMADGLTIVPGLNFAFGAGTSGAGPPDVMRGEETQVLGALERRAELAESCRLVMPGTHSKWVRVERGRIEGFRTYMTGEVFAVMRDHSILGRPALAAAGDGNKLATDATAPGDAFERGVADAKSAGAAGLASRLFSVRTRVLAGEFAAKDSLDYLSGILVGDEIRAGLSDMHGGAAPLALIGDARICGLYRRAFALFEIPDVAALDDTASAGLWRLATAAGLTKTQAAAKA